MLYYNNYSKYLLILYNKITINNNWVGPNPVGYNIIHL